MGDGYHFSVSLGHELWDELLKGALPIEVGKGQFELLSDAHRSIRALHVRERFVDLLEDRAPKELVSRAKRRISSLWNRGKGPIRDLGKKLVRVEGDWAIQIDHDGSGFNYFSQRIRANVMIKGRISGRVELVGERVSIPFTIERRAGASVDFSEIRFDPNEDAIVGLLRNGQLHLGTNPLVELAARLVESLAEGQLAKLDPITVLPRDQLQGILGPMAGSLNVNMGVEDMVLDVTEEAIALRVRFGFTHKQLEER